ncbi:MAG TPA: AhpC/TSA family protein, partial [Chitinophagaceae bacterium]
KAIYDDNLTWTHVSDLKFWSNEVAQKYKIESIPQNFLVGPDGKIVARNLRGEALEQKLCELLGCN